MNRCFRCGYEIMDTEFSIQMTGAATNTSADTKIIQLCMDCVEDLEREFKQAREMAAKIRSRQWIGSYGE